MKMFGELRLVRAITDQQIAAMRDPRLVPNTKLPRIEDAVKAGGFLAGTPADIIEQLKSGRAALSGPRAGHLHHAARHASGRHAGAARPLRQGSDAGLPAPAAARAAAADGRIRRERHDDLRNAHLSSEARHTPAGRGGVRRADRRLAPSCRASPASGAPRSARSTRSSISGPTRTSNERDQIRAEAVKIGVWPPKIADFVLDMESKILHPAPFSPHFEPGEHGNIYEFRTYTYGAGRHPQGHRGLDAAHQGAHRHLAADLRRLHRHRRAQPVGPCLGLQEHGRARDAARPGDEARRSGRRRATRAWSCTSRRAPSPSRRNGRRCVGN